MKKLSLRITAAACALLVTAASAVSCTGTQKNAGENTSALSEKSVSEAGESEKILRSSEILGEYNFEGAVYSILKREYSKLGDLPSYEFTTEDENGELINDTIYRRNSIVEELYNITVESILPSGGVYGTVEKSVASADGAYDLVWAHINDVSSLASNRLLSNYYEIPVIDITQPWWNQLATESLTLNGQCYLQMNYIPFTGVLLSHCLYFNKDTAEKYDCPVFYDMVRDNSWTFDSFAAAVKTAGSDIDGNGVYDENDGYGLLASHGTSGVAFSVAMNVKAADIREDGIFELVLPSDRNQSILEMITSLMSEPSSYLILDYSKENDLAKMFTNGQALFYSGFLTDSFQFFRGMDSDFGLLPFPKYDREQKSYITTITGGTGLLGIPKVLNDETKSGVITEALAIESYQYIYPAVYETVFENKVLRDADSLEMFDLLMDGMEIDFARVFKYADYTDLFANLLASGSSDLASSAKKFDNAAVKHYEKLIGMYFEEE